VVADTVADLKHIMERNRPADLSALSDDDLIRAWEMTRAICCGGFAFFTSAGTASLC
jgi:hypothetical protein